MPFLKDYKNKKTELLTKEEDHARTKRDIAKNKILLEKLTTDLENANIKLKGMQAMKEGFSGDTDASKKARDEQLEASQK